MIKVFLVITAVLLVFVMLSSVISPALAANTGNTELKEFKFKQLYRDDKEFKKNIDQIRKILTKKG